VRSVGAIAHPTAGPGRVSVIVREGSHAQPVWPRAHGGSATRQVIFVGRRIERSAPLSRLGEDVFVLGVTRQHLSAQPVNDIAERI
jgi:hypothetical protein